MKKWGFYLFLLLFLDLASFSIEPISVEKADGGPIDMISTCASSIKITKDNIYKGNLLLVNKDYPIPEKSVRSDIVDLRNLHEWGSGYGWLHADIRLSERVAQNFAQMVHAAEKEGVNHFMINSGYRDFKEQNKLYQEMGPDYALPPGYSEHNLGLSLDVGSSQMKMEKAPEGKWLRKNAWKYGFILRYPEDKTAITGIQYEPWHIRYVGLPHSAIMHEKNVTLEEYLTDLKEKRNITANVNGKKYAISYYPVSKTLTIKTPGHCHYEISGNNMDGVIVTTFP
ncbi:D-Ala-D-Ala carboxypeptidase VanY [Fictibacillus gelatini]|uniref:D-Ala-D-Ala carboxypeptidase VanY n=1 Tax=Fictibacillus gelatini TaxID=225985 RepID=UPI00042952C0|nr:D-Ala-D-Ala carboxypeptidase VanY [Fictibacillus gelatini]